MVVFTIDVDLSLGGPKEFPVEKKNVLET